MRALRIAFAQPGCVWPKGRVETRPTATLQRRKHGYLNNLVQVGASRASALHEMLLQVGLQPFTRCSCRSGFSPTWKPIKPKRRV